MQEIKLDFSRGRRAPRWIAPALLALAVSFVGDVGYSFAKSLREIAVNEKKLAKVEPRNYRAPRKVAPEEVMAARETMQRLATPWDKLFGALEQASSDQVALLSIEPDAKAGKVTISGDSKDYLAALTYVLNLGRADSLSHVELARHEVKQNAVAFSVSASWGK